MNEAPTVFLVDDDEDVRRGLSRLLRAAGHSVETFDSATGFLEATVDERPGCLVLDVRLPNLGGMDLQEALEARGFSIPIVFITGHGDVPTGIRAMKAGAEDFLTKPIVEGDLLAAVGRALERDAAQRKGAAAQRVLMERVKQLTARERQVFELVAAGLLNKQIAGRLGTTDRTVKLHRARVMRKLQALSSADLVRIAERLGMVAVGVSPLDTPT